MHQIHPIPPVLNSGCHTLILGSFPSVKSRENAFYYGHRQNRFWPLMAAVLGEEIPLTIPDKQAMLLRHGLALWDVIASCEIDGSADASIRSVQPVDIRRITAAAPIRRVICNGSLASRLYRQHLQPITGIPALTAPSTSPANAAWPLPRLIQAWRILLDQESR